jgi:apolipoprotein D and lipocalin family protein
LIAYLNTDYAQTVIGRNPRDDVRILARTPAMPAADDQRLLGELAAQGDDLGKRRKVPQRWPGQNQPPLPADGGTGAAVEPGRRRFCGVPLPPRGYRGGRIKTCP